MHERDIAFDIKVVFFALLLLIAAYFLFAKGAPIFQTSENGMQYLKAEVTEIGEIEELENDPVLRRVERYGVRLLEGDQTELELERRQGKNQPEMKPLRVGEEIIVVTTPIGTTTQYNIFEKNRIPGVIYLAIFFGLCILVFGLFKGFQALLGLIFTVASLLLVFIPAVLNGHNIYIGTVLVSIYVTVVTVLLINGRSKKSLVTILGCSLGFAAAMIGSLVMTSVLRLSGALGSDTPFLIMLFQDKPIELKGIIFAMVVIGAIGAVMDVAMDLSSSLFEISEQAPDITRRNLFLSGIRIGRDVMGTMVNTLVLAYVGSSLASVLLMAGYSYSVLELFNHEMIIVEIVQALIGSLAILVTMPLTALVGTLVYHHKV